MAEEQERKATFSQSQIRDGVLKMIGLPERQQTPQKFNKLLGFLNKKSPVTQTTTPTQNTPGGV